MATSFEGAGRVLITLFQYLIAPTLAAWGVHWFSVRKAREERKFENLVKPKHEAYMSVLRDLRELVSAFEALLYWHPRIQRLSDPELLKALLNRLLPSGRGAISLSSRTYREIEKIVERDYGQERGAVAFVLFVSDVLDCTKMTADSISHRALYMSADACESSAAVAEAVRASLLSKRIREHGEDDARWCEGELSRVKNCYRKVEEQMRREVQLLA